MRWIGPNRRVAAVTVVVIMVGTMTGCQVMGPIGPTGPRVFAPEYRYQLGTAVQGFMQPRSEVEAATRSAMADLGIRRNGPAQWNPDQTEVYGRLADGRRVHLTIADRGPMTEARVRVGLFGDEPLSKTLLDRIGIRLGARPPEPVPEQLPSDPESNPYFSREGVPDSIMLRNLAKDGYNGYQDVPGP